MDKDDRKTGQEFGGLRTAYRKPADSNNEDVESDHIGKDLEGEGREISIHAPDGLPEGYYGNLEHLAPYDIPIAEARRDKRKAELIKEIDELLLGAYYEDRNRSLGERPRGENVRYAQTDWPRMAVLFEQDIRDVINALQRKWSTANRNVSPANRTIEKLKRRKYKNIITWERAQEHRLPDEAWDRMDKVSVKWNDEVVDEDGPKGIGYTKYVSMEGEKQRQSMPPCPECGSVHVISKGAYWLCRECGKWFTKKLGENSY